MQKPAPLQAAKGKAMRGHVRERSPGHWAIVIDVRDPATGKRRRKWHSFRGTKRQAQDERTRLLAELNSGSYVEPSKATFAQFLDQWLDDVRSRVTPKTHERYAQICHKNIGPLLGAITLGKLKPEQISEAYAKSLTTGRRKGDGGLSPRTVRQMHAIVKSSLAQAVIWGILARNPAAVVKGPKPSRVVMQTYDLDQTAEMIEAARGDRVFMPAMLAVLCGMRRGEVAALRWRNVRRSLRSPNPPNRPRPASGTRNPRAAAVARSHCLRRLSPSSALIASLRLESCCWSGAGSTTMTL
jgi:integrase